MSRTAIEFILKAGVIWVTLLITSILGAMSLGLGGEAVADDGPFRGDQAFLIVNGLHALVLSAIAVRANLAGWKLGVLLGVTLFLAQSFLLVIEALYFAGSVNAPMKELRDGSVLTLMGAIGVVIVASLFWRRAHATDHSELRISRLVFPVAAVAILYVFSYFTAGYFIAWAVPEVRAYYGEGIEIELVPLLAFQVIRGALWALLALALVRSMRDGVVMTAIIVGAAFSVLASAQLLYPNPFMPWAVRLPHLIEVGISNFLFGAIAALILRRSASG